MIHCLQDLSYILIHQRLEIYLFAKTLSLPRLRRPVGLSRPKYKQLDDRLTVVHREYVLFKLRKTYRFVKKRRIFLGIG